MKALQTAASAVVVIASLATGGCALNASPASGLQFQAPAGWQASPGVMGMMQFWRPPADDHQVLMLFKSPRKIRESEAFSDARAGQTFQDLTIERRQTIRICGDQSAMYVRGRGSSKGEPSVVESVIADTGGATYVSLYVRPVASPADIQAEAALRQLCPKP